VSRILVTGLSGQDGSYLGEQLLAEGHEVHALVRASAPHPHETLTPLAVETHVGDLGDPVGLRRLVEDLAPDVIYNLGGISSVAQSWDEPVLTGRVSGLALAALLEGVVAVRDRSGHDVRVVQASSSEIFGEPATVPQNEETPIAPLSPYGVAKAYAHEIARAFRSRGVHVSNAILYNHESPRRPVHFVTRKITHGAAMIARGRQERLKLGNIAARRDWGWAPDYVDAMIRMANAPSPGDYVVATGETHTVSDFISAAFRRAGIDEWHSVVSVDESLLRVADVSAMVGDAAKASAELGWAPTIGFEEIVSRMVDHDLALLDGEHGGD